MDVDLRERFEASFRSEPPLRPADELVDAGRRALRRRRTVTAAAVGVAACAAAVVVATTQLGGHSSSVPQPIEHPRQQTGGEVEARLTAATPIDATWRPDCGHASRPYCDTHAYALAAAPVSIRADGTLVRIGADVTIAREAVDATPPSGTRRYEVEVRTPDSIHSRWYVVRQDPSGGVVVEQADPSTSQVDFDTWASAVNRDVEVPGAPPLDPTQVVIQD
jgi:hypothetical protein